MHKLIVRNPSKWGSFPGFYLAGSIRKLYLVDHPEDASKFSATHAALVEDFFKQILGAIVSREAL